MEQSSDSLQHTSAQNQARVLALEQEKVKIGQSRIYWAR